MYYHWLIATVVISEFTCSAARDMPPTNCQSCQVFNFQTCNLTKVKPIDFNCYAELILC